VSSYHLKNVLSGHIPWNRIIEEPGNPYRPHLLLAYQAPAVRAGRAVTPTACQTFALARCVRLATQNAYLTLQSGLAEPRGNGGGPPAAEGFNDALLDNLHACAYDAIPQGV
jgi:hypothetical protein